VNQVILVIANCWFLLRIDISEIQTNLWRSCLCDNSNHMWSYEVPLF